MVKSLTGLKLLSMLTPFATLLIVQSAWACSPNASLRSGASAGLSDCRAYEQVSPVDKNGTNAFTPTFPLPVEVSATEGNGEISVAYQTLGELEEPSPAFPGQTLPAALLGNAYLATRTASGWQTSNLTPPTSGPIPTSVGAAYVGYDFSPNLSRDVIAMPWQALAPETPARLDNLFLHGPDGTYSLLTTAPPKVPVPENCVLCYALRDIPAYAGTSTDYTHVIFEASESLTAGAPGEGVENLYESYETVPGQAREVRLVGVLPDGMIPPEGSMPGAGIEDNRVNHYSGGAERSASNNIAHAISADGSHIVFSANADEGGPDAEQHGMSELYDRVEGSRTIEISAPAGGVPPPNTTAEPAQFWAASADGSVVLFTSRAELTTQSRTGLNNASQDLYRYDVHAGSLTDLTVDSSLLDATSGAGVQGVVGASEDGSYIYFVATGRLTEEATDGQPNLYVSYGGGPPRFIATLNNEDLHDWNIIPAESNAYVTPDGRHLAFMSINRLTGYDNEDQNTSQPDSEVYEYSAEEGSLVCASCEPDGARPLGNAFTGAGLGSDRLGTPFYQPRVLSDNGARLFFSSPGHTLENGVGVGYAKVFEYEQAGSGSCTAMSGCVYPLSYSAASANDIFLDASPSGEDVFFATYDQLVSGDQDNLMDIYDARVDGGFAPTSTPSLPCVGGACQGSPPTPPAFGPPASTIFVGAGDGTSTASAPTGPRSRTVAQIRTERLARALRACHSRKNGRKRAICDAKARKRYGAQKASDRRTVR